MSEDSEVPVSKAAMVLLSEVASLEDGTDVITIADANPDVFPMEADVHRASAELEALQLVTASHRRRKAGRKGHRTVRSLSVTDKGWKVLLEGASTLPLDEALPLVANAAVGTVINDTRKRGLFTNLGSGRKWVKRYPGKWYLEVKFGNAASVVLHDKLLAHLIDHDHFWFTTDMPNMVGASASEAATGPRFSLSRPNRLLPQVVISVSRSDLNRQARPDVSLAVLAEMGFKGDGDTLSVAGSPKQCDLYLTMIQRYLPNSTIQSR